MSDIKFGSLMFIVSLWGYLIFSKVFEAVSEIRALRADLLVEEDAEESE